MLRILNKLKMVATTQDLSFERSLAFMLENSHRHNEWLLLKNNGKVTLTSDDLQWVPEKWWKLVVGDTQRNAVLTKINRRQFEVCVCAQMVRELNSGDICVIGSDDYSDHRDELVPMDECELTRADYGEKVGLPIESTAFIEHVRSMKPMPHQPPFVARLKAVLKGLSINIRNVLKNGAQGRRMSKTNKRSLFHQLF